MRQADRLLKLIQILRRHRKPVTAKLLAHELEISERTVYRDISGLVADGAPIRGEAGIGYVLGPGYDLPPLMFTADEVEALVVGMSWVESRADAGLAAAARDVLAKVGAVVPECLAPLLIERTVEAPSYGNVPQLDLVDVGQLRFAVRERRKVRLEYSDQQGAKSTRVVWPLALGYFELSRVLVAWCELRQGFRHFRTDRILRATVTESRYQGARAKLMRAWREEMDGFPSAQPLARRAIGGS
ncbi:MAG: YafY family protein [Hyphomicrobium sp.]|jgi:predicted DNA-binding transcriptional regulator YafY